MIKSISYVSLLVKNYDEAIEFYTQKLGFVVVDNQPMPQMGENMRWVEIAPAKESETKINLALATHEPVLSTVGKQGGDSPFLTLYCSNIEEDIANFKNKGVSINSPIGDQPWGKDCMIEDLYGNAIYIVESV